MQDSAEAIRELVNSVVEPLVDNPESLEVTSSLSGTNILVEIATDPDDAGKVIGRSGRVIKSIRTLARAAATRKGLSVDVELIEE